MIQIGIDFSLNSPSVCINVDNAYLHFISFFNDGGKDWKSSKSKSWHYHNLLREQSIIELVPYTRHVDKTNYRTEQKSKMADAMMIADLIADSLSQYKGLDSNISIGIEGFSFQSRGSEIDLILYNSFLREKLAASFGFDNINIISPAEVKKKLSGKGNANKDIMIDAFKSNIPNSDLIKKCKLFEFLNSHEIDYKNIKPIDDLIDSFGVMYSI